MLTIACNSYYNMFPLNFLEEAEKFSQKLKENQKYTPRIHLQVGSIVARVGFLPQLVQTFLGMLHFGIITQEKGTSLENSYSDLFFHVNQFHLNNIRTSKYFFLKREFFDRFQIQHYGKKEEEWNVQKTSLGVFIFGEETWNNGSWVHKAIPSCWLIQIPHPNVETLQKKIRFTLGEKKYNLFYRNCESYVMDLIFGKEAVYSTSFSIQVLVGLFFLLLLILLVCLVSIWLIKKEKKQNKWKKKKIKEIKR